MDKEMMKGSIDLLLLAELHKEDSYGYEIVKNIKKSSEGVYEMGEGTAYPALKRLEQKGLTESYWGEGIDGGRRKYYRITEKGKKELTQKLKNWKILNKLIADSTGGLI